MFCIVNAEYGETLLLEFLNLVGGGGSDMECSNVEALNRRILARNMLGQNHQDSCLERFGTYIHSVQLVRVSVQIHS